MLQSQLNQAIMDNKTIKDELDNSGDLIFGHIITILISSLLCAFIFNELIASSKENPFAYYSTMTIFAIIGQLFHLKIRHKEHSLIKLDTNQTLKENIEAVNKLSTDIGLSNISEELNYFQFYKRHWFNIPTYKIVLIPFDNCIYLNIRTVGTNQGRIPYNFGFCSLFQKKVIRRLKLLITQA